MRHCKAVTWEKGEHFEVEGQFHQWANGFEDCGEAGIANYTVALIELDNGKIVECPPDTVVFLDRISPYTDWLRDRFNRTT